MFNDAKTKIGLIAALVVLSLVFLVPTFLGDKMDSKNWITKPISLGLDLSGGVHLVYEVQTDEAIKSKLQTMLTAIRSRLRNEKIALTRAKVNDQFQMEFTLLSDKFAERTKSKVAEDFKELSFIGEGQDEDKVKYTYGLSQIQREKIASESISQAVETLRERVDQFGVSEPVIQKVGTNRIMLQMPGVSDVESVKKIVGSVAKLEFKLIPIGGTGSRVTLKNREGLPVVVEEEALMSGDAIQDARVEILNGQIEVLLTFTNEGRRTFSRITTESVNRQLAVILDNVVYSSPVINEPITTGNAQITGGFTMEEAKQLKVVLKAGALPAPLKVVEERTVGPTLGKESIQRGVLAIVVGFAAIIIFMLVYYKKAGMVAVGSLILNLVFIVGALTLFGATLTLPGLAGLALTIGMAVDSNVIIFERIKDELRNSATRDAAVRAGFDKALSAIIDSNVTTFLAGTILYFLGTGPIKGFAVTLSIGILTTIFCATFVSRLAFDTFELKGKNKLSI